MIAKAPAKLGVPFVGRSAELQQLRDTLERARRTSKPAFVLIEGDYGVGKTALVEQFLDDALEEDQTLLIGQGRCTMETEVSGLIPMSQLLKALAERGIQRRNVPGHLLDFVKEVAPAWLDIFTLGAASATIKTFEEGAKLFAGGTLKQENVFAQFTNAIVNLAEKQPIIAFIDDMQWADASSLSLLFHQARYLRNGSILFLCAYRTVEAMETSSNADLFRVVRANLIRYGATQIEVDTGIDVPMYAALRYLNNSFPSDFLAQVQERTGGHALFVSQLFSFWEETSIVVQLPDGDGGSTWRLTEEIGTLPLVPQLRTVLEERIRRMESALREMLTFASVEGENFTVQVLARMRQLDEYQVCESLETLEHRYRLIQEVEATESGSTMVDFYRFAHRFFREHIYGSLSGVQRRILHQQVGECLEALYEDRHLVAGQLALHFREARNSLKAANYALMAAKLEQSRYAVAEAQAWSSLGLEVLKNLEPSTVTKALRLDLLQQAADGHFVSANYIKADATYREALKLSQETLSGAERLAELYDKLAETNRYIGQTQDAVRFAEQGKQVLIDSGIPFDEVHLRVDIGWAYLQSWTGRDDLAIECIHEALAKAEELTPTRTLESSRCRAYNVLALALSSLVRYSEAIGAEHRAIKVARAISDKRQEAISQINLADVLFWSGNLHDAMAAASKGMQIATEIGDLDEIAFAHDVRGAVLLALGRAAEAREEVLQAIDISEQSGAAWNAAGMYANLALACLALSETDSAHEYASRAVQSAQEQEYADLYQAGCAFDALAHVEMARQEWESSERCFQQALAFHGKTSDRHLLARSHRGFGLSLSLAGKRQEAIEQLRSAMSIFQELGLDHEIPRTQEALEGIDPSLTR